MVSSTLLTTTSLTIALHLLPTGASPSIARSTSRSRTQSPRRIFSAPFHRHFGQSKARRNHELSVQCSGSEEVRDPGEVIRKYFQCWNERRMEDAIGLFDESLSYEDTLYPGKFEGKNSLKGHLYSIAGAVPDDLAVAPYDEKGIANVGVQWHVGLDDGTALPFTRGCSMYKVDRNGRIVFGFDVPEPVAKTGNISLGILKAVSGILKLLNRK
ncbi:hypothetical protein AAMO2058_000228100 [Amorphochlora amoebiformis]